MDQATDRRFVAVGVGHSPRWLLPVDEPCIVKTMRGAQPRTWWKRLAWYGVQAAVQRKKLNLLAQCKAPEGIDSLDWWRFGWSSSTEPILVLYIGPLRSKVVVHLVDPSSKYCELIVKVPLTDLAAKTIIREADNLTALASDNIPGTPRLVYLDRDSGISAETYIQGPRDRGTLTSSHWRALNSLQVSTDGTSLVDIVPGLQCKLASCSNRADQHTILMALADLADPTPLPSCWIHGDFSPWNLKNQPDGTLGIVDWEGGRRGGLPLQDAFYFIHMRRLCSRSKPRSAFKDLSDPASAIGINRDLCRKLEIAFLAELYLRTSQYGDLKLSEYLLATLELTLHTSRRRYGSALRYPRKAQGTVDSSASDILPR